jgi:hypothetical protein
MHSCIFLAFRSSWPPGRHLTGFGLDVCDGGEGMIASEAQVV